MSCEREDPVVQIDDGIRRQASSRAIECVACRDVFLACLAGSRFAIERYPTAARAAEVPGDTSVQRHG